jgi:hypothetical protein
MKGNKQGSTENGRMSETAWDWTAQSIEGIQEASTRSLLRVSDLKRRSPEPWEETLAYRCFQEPHPIHFDGVSGFTTKQLTEAWIQSICPDWVRVFVTIQFQGKPGKEMTEKTLKEASILRDKLLVGEKFNRRGSAQLRTLDFFFEEEGAGKNSGNRHFHGLVLIAPNHPKLHAIEQSLVDSVSMAMVRHLSMGAPKMTDFQHQQVLARKQSGESGKVIVAERCLNRACALGYSMKQFDVSKSYLSCIDYIDAAQLKKLPQIRREDFLAALPKAPRYARQYSVCELAAQGTPPPPSRPKQARQHGGIPC